MLEAGKEKTSEHDKEFRGVMYLTQGTMLEAGKEKQVNTTRNSGRDVLTQTMLEAGKEKQVNTTRNSGT